MGKPKIDPLVCRLSKCVLDRYPTGRIRVEAKVEVEYRTQNGTQRRIEDATFELDQADVAMLTMWLNLPRK